MQGSRTKYLILVQIGGFIQFAQLFLPLPFQDTPLVLSFSFEESYFTESLEGFYGKMLNYLTDVMDITSGK